MTARRVAIVTGAAQGLGFGIATALGRSGYDLAIADLDAEPISDAAGQLTARGWSALGVRCDVGSRDDAQAAVDATVAAYGRIDVVVNNAQTTRMGPLLTAQAADIDAVWRSGFLGTLHMMQASQPHLAAAGGSVVNVASGAGLSAPAGYGVYAATKEAIRTITRVAALEWGPAGVRVNAISPSARTPAFDRWAASHAEEAERRVQHIPLRRLGDPTEDVGEAVVFLAGPSAAYITGTTLVVDGGAHYLR